MMERLSIQELAAVLTVKNGLKKKEAEQFVTLIFEVVKDNLISERQVKIKGLGTFKIVDIEPRESINVNTGERMLIEGHEKITFTPDTAMKELVNRPFSQFETVILNDGVKFDVTDDTTDDTPLSVEEDVDDESVDTPVMEDETEASTSTEEEIIPIVEEEEIESSTQDIDANEESVEDNEPTETEVLSEDIPEAIDEDEEPAESTDEEPAEPTDEEPVESAEENEPIETTDDDSSEVIYDEDLETENSSAWKKWLGFALVACVLSFFAGYKLGGYNAVSNSELSDSIQVPIKDLAVSNDTLSTVKSDTSKTVKKETVVVADVPSPAPKAQPAAPQLKEKPQPEPVKPVTAAAAENSGNDNMVDYGQMSARVRTGAYRIVGTDREVTAKEGETVGRIARRVLGPEMECYVEVYNGIKADVPLKAGQTIKIPKLQLKKKKTQQPINQE